MIAAGETEIARDELVWLLSECPDFLEAHVHLGLIALEEGDPKLARGHFGRAYELCLRALDAEARGGDGQGRKLFGLGERGVGLLGRTAMAGGHVDHDRGVVSLLHIRLASVLPRRGDHMPGPGPVAARGLEQRRLPLVEHGKTLAAKAGRPYEYRQGSLRKEAWANEIIHRDRLTEGLVGVL